MRFLQQSSESHGSWVRVKSGSRSQSILCALPDPKLKLSESNCVGVKLSSFSPRRICNDYVGCKLCQVVEDWAIDR
uniref:Uncharacterized protein n=1 Tax=Romanomermis culicivorax TaxID=13658 RepID=A0A915K0N3_ROMCU